jgi:aminoglycoside N3'-acetyltransferase
MSSFGHVEGGADGVIDALEGVLTDWGTLVMPTFSGELIYMLESLALQSGINGKGTGKGVVFDGTATGLWEELSEIAAKAGITFPFVGVSDLVNRVTGEGPGILKSVGWSIALEGEGTTATLRIARDAEPIPEDEVKPWRMPAWTGTIPDTFWRRPETLRSHQYSGSFSAWGRLAETLLEGHDNRPGQKVETHPLYRMKEARGKVLLLGVDHRVNSTIHVAQWAAFAECGMGDLQARIEFLKDFQTVDQPLDRLEGQTTGRIGSAVVRLADTRTLFKVVAGLLLKGGTPVKRT